MLKSYIEYLVIKTSPTINLKGVRYTLLMALCSVVLAKAQVTAVDDNFNYICPIENPNIGNVMDNDIQNQSFIKPSLYLVTEVSGSRLTIGAGGVISKVKDKVITVDSHGVVAVSKDVIQGQTYILQYRITQIGNPDNHNTGTLTVLFLSGEDTAGDGVIDICDSNLPLPQRGNNEKNDSMN